MTVMCCALEVSVSGFYAWRKRKPSQRSREDAELAGKIKTAFQSHRCVYGSPRIHAELHAQGWNCARKRVARLMQELDLVAKRPRHPTVTTKSEEGAAVAPNLLQQDFHAMALARRRPQAGLLHHSDRGSTSTSQSYLALVEQNGMVPSMSRTANCYDNAATESFFHSIKGESLDHESFQTRAQARNSIFDSRETFYHRTRRHSTLQYLSPVEFEQSMG